MYIYIYMYLSPSLSLYIYIYTHTSCTHLQSLSGGDGQATRWVCLLFSGLDVLSSTIQLAD